MIEKDFKDEIQRIELPNTDKKQIINFANDTISLIKQNINKNIKIIIIEVGGSFKKQTMILDENHIDILVAIELKNKKLPKQLLFKSGMNEIENILLNNLKNNILFNQETKDVIFNRNYKRGILTFISPNNFQINYIIRYNEESIIKDSDKKDLHNYNLYLKQMNFVEEANKIYPKFIHSIKLLKQFRNELDIKNISNYLLEIILFYSLENHYFENNYADYIKSFIYGLDDFINQKKIEISNEMYKKIGVSKTMTTEGKFIIIDVVSPSTNLIDDNFDINEFKNFKRYLLTKLPRDEATISIDVSFNFLVKDKTIEWSFIIEGTSQKNNGGEYEYTQENIYMTILRSTLKALQFVVKNKLGNSVDIKCDYPEVFCLEKYNDENASRIANIRMFIQENNLNVTYLKK